MDMYDPEYVVILSGDHIYKMNYAKMVEAHKKAGAADQVLPELLPGEDVDAHGGQVALRLFRLLLELDNVVLPWASSPSTSPWNSTATSAPDSPGTSTAWTAASISDGLSGLVQGGLGGGSPLGHAPGLAPGLLALLCLRGGLGLRLGLGPELALPPQEHRAEGRDADGDRGLLPVGLLPADLAGSGVDRAGAP